MTEKGQKSPLLHLYHFVKEHWGEIYVAFDITKGFFNKEKPSDDAHHLVKLVHGGKNSIEDEIAYEPIELELDTDQYALMGHFRDWAKTRLGNGPLGKYSYSNWDNAFRGMVLRRREPARTEYDTTTSKNEKGKDVEKKSERQVPVNNQPAINFLRRFSAEMQKGRDESSGSDEAEKIKDGCLRANNYLIRFNLPSVKLDSTLVKIDESIGKLPRHAVNAGRRVRILDKKLNRTTAKKEARLSWWRRLMRF